MAIIKENAPTCQDNMTTQQHGILHKDENFIKVQGQVNFDMRDAVTGEVLEQRTINNVVTKDMSVLLARLCVGGSNNVGGIKYLAMGTGDSSWNLQSPSPATPAQISLENEISRKTFSEPKFKIANGNDSPNGPTNIVDFTATFEANEAVGSLVELGLIGGNADPYSPNIRPVGKPGEEVDVTNYDTLCTYLTFPVINKPSSAVLTITYRLTF